MKKRIFTLLTFSAMLAMPLAAHADLLAGWDTWTSTTAPAPNVTGAGVTASTTTSTSSGNWGAGEGGGNAGRGSSGDGTWGTYNGDGVAPSTSTTLQADNFLTTNGRVSAEITFTLTNNGALDLMMDAFHMDVIEWRPNATSDYELSVLSGGLTAGSVGTGALTHQGGGDLSSRDTHEDIDISLAGLADNTLAVGESAVIQLNFTGGTGSGGGHHLFLDNVAFSGTPAAAIPEPSSLAILGLAGMTLFVRRRR